MAKLPGFRVCLASLLLYGCAGNERPVAQPKRRAWRSNTRGWQPVVLPLEGLSEAEVVRQIGQPNQRRTSGFMEPVGDVAWLVGRPKDARDLPHLGPPDCDEQWIYFPREKGEDVAIWARFQYVYFLHGRVALAVEESRTRFVDDNSEVVVIDGLAKKDVVELLGDPKEKRLTGFTDFKDPMGAYYTSPVPPFDEEWVYEWGDADFVTHILSVCFLKVRVVFAIDYSAAW